MSDDRPSFVQRKDEVRKRLPIGGVIERVIKLSGTAGSRNRRGKCPFHNGNSPSFSVQTDKGFAHCFGCQWHGDVIGFVEAYQGLPFVEALAECEKLAGIVPAGGRANVAFGSMPPAPVQRERNPSSRPRRERALVEPIDMGRWIWKHADAFLPPIRRYFIGRGVAAAVLSDDRLQQFRYLADCPCFSWPAGEQPHPGRVKGMLVAPAVIALVRRPVWIPDDGASGNPAVGMEAEGRTSAPPAPSALSLSKGGRLDFKPVGVHVTYLAPDGVGAMVRRKPWARPGDEDPMLPKRRMLGAVGGGAVFLGTYRPDAALWIGEGNETTFSGMGLAALRQDREGRVPEDWVGVATLSLDNLQGAPKLWRNRTWPLFAIAPDPERPGFRIPGHRGPVTGLIDSDMSPLRGMRDHTTGAYLGEAVVERKGGPIVRRAITGAERAAICGELFVKGWRACLAASGGVAQVEALRAPMGMDFNDVAQAEQRSVA